MLAAGAGSRFGGSKLMAPLHGEPLICTSVRRALLSPIAMVHVVTGDDHARIASALAQFGRKVRVVQNPKWQEGISTSLKVGIASLPKETLAALIFLGDMPWIPETLSSELLAKVGNGALAAYPVHNGKPGHPVSLHKSGFSLTRQTKCDEGLGKILRRIEDRVVAIACNDPGCIRDVDSPADLPAC